MPFTFNNPLWFLALLAIPLVFWIRSKRPTQVLVVPNAAAWYRPSFKSHSPWPMTLATLGIILLVTALARPQIVEDKREVHVEGYDIMLAVDLSGSMLAEDYMQNGRRINRLQAIKPVIQAFITERPSDRIGIVLFGERSYTLAPLTFDHAWLARQLERLKIGIVEEGRTAIGDGLGLALSRLQQAGRDSAAGRKGGFVVLLTDGENNAGVIEPMQAAAIAKSRNIPVFTIAAGKNGIVPVPVHDEKTGQRIGTGRMHSFVDEEMLKQIAKETGGNYYQAFTSDTVKRAFADINKSQKIEFQSKSYLTTTELFPYALIPAIFFLTLAPILSRRK